MALTSDGVNLAGVRRILQLQEQARQLHRDPGRRVSQSLDPRPTSQHYRYSHTLPAGGTGGQTTQQWDRQAVPGGQDNAVDLVHGPGGAEARAIAALAEQNLTA